MLDADRRTAWTEVAAFVRRDPRPEPIDLWVTFARILSVDEAAAVVGRTRISGVLLAYPDDQGLTVVSVQHLDVTVGAGGLGAVASQMLARGPFDPPPPALPAAPPVAGLRLRAVVADLTG
ncbi:MAG: hypothetical protein ABIW46_00660, partial [Acidimicrobiales bacterium]